MTRPLPPQRQKVRDALTAIAILLGIAAGITFAVWWQLYRWQDCRHVGHAVVYCIMTIGK